MARAPAWCRRLPDVDARSETAPGPPAEASAVEVPPPPRQRWRLVLARAADAPELAGRELIDVWETALEASGLPLFRPVGRVRGRIAFGAPIPATLEVERELADILLTEFVPTWRVREGLAGHLPDGWRLVDLYDVWLGSPALAGQVAAADYRIGVTGADGQALAAAAAAPAGGQPSCRATARRAARPSATTCARCWSTSASSTTARRRCSAPERASTRCSGPGGPRRSSRRSATRSAPRSIVPRSCASG